MSLKSQVICVHSVYTEFDVGQIYDIEFTDDSKYHFRVSYGDGDRYYTSTSESKYTRFISLSEHRMNELEKIDID